MKTTKKGSLNLQKTSFFSKMITLAEFYTALRIDMAGHESPEGLRLEPLLSIELCIRETLNISGPFNT